jgi:hypothetical protein
MYTSFQGEQSVAVTLDELYKYGTTPLMPPEVVAERGRNRVKRIESQSVNPTMQKKSRVGRPNGRKQRKCPHCGLQGHFSRNKCSVSLTQTMP